MQCQFAQELFSDHISDTLDRAQKVSLDNHLADCGNCREQVAGLRDLWASLDTLPVVEPPKFFHENIMDRIATEAVKEREAQQALKAAGFDWRSLFGRRSLAFGAAAVVLLLGALGVTQTQQGSLNPFAFFSRGAAKSAPPTPLALQTAGAAWVPGSGSLVVTLRPTPSANGAVSAINYEIRQAGSAAPLKSGILFSQRDSTLTIPMAAQPAPDSLSVKLIDPDSASRTLTIPLPLALPAQ